MIHPARRQRGLRPRAPSRQKVRKRPSFEPHSAVTTAAGSAFGDQLDAQERPCDPQMPGGNHAISIALMAQRMNYIVFIAVLMSQVSGRSMSIDDILRCGDDQRRLRYRPPVDRNRRKAPSVVSLGPGITEIIWYAATIACETRNVAKDRHTGPCAISKIQGRTDRIVLRRSLHDEVFN